MNKSRLKIWCNIDYADAVMDLLHVAAAGHELILAAAMEPAAARRALAEADVAFGQPAVDVVRNAPALRWAQVASAGYEHFDNEALRAALRARGAQLTNSSSVYDEPCAQHLLAQMMAAARRLPDALLRQQTDHSWPTKELRDESYLLTEQTTVLLGFGAIARRLVELLAPLRMNLIAVRRQRMSDAPIRVITEAELDDYLPLADHLISTLPTNASTRHFVNAARLSRLKPGAIFYNVGRGTTVDQEALLAALQTGQLAAAYLDVTDPEPLPPAHPLWRAPNCIITPHTAGGHRGEQERLMRHFLNNLQRFIAGNELLDRII
jgi:phosphoglycerate dehydrogenase-like enzyme